MQLRTGRLPDGSLHRPHPLHATDRGRTPVAAYRAEFPAHLERLANRSMDYFHLYAFRRAA